MSERHATPGPVKRRFTDVRRHGEIDSTNREAADLARAGAAEGVVVVADHQTEGRGRRGRRWEAPVGSSLLVSVILRPLPDPPRADAASGMATIACALAAADACSDVGGFRPGLKWPNDLVVGDRKLAGVLAELVPAAGGGPPAVVVGLGLNVSWPEPLPPFLERSAVTAESVAGRAVDRDALLDAYLARLDRRWSTASHREGVAVLLDDYRRQCVSLGRTVHVELPGGGSWDGIATSVDDDGSLLVAASGTVRRVTAGDVVHVDPDAPPLS